MKIKFLLCCAFLCSIFLSPGFGFEKQTSKLNFGTRKAYNNAKKLFRNKHYRKALEKFIEIEKTDKNYPAVHTQIGLIYEKLAEKAILSSVKLDYYTKALEEYQKLPKKNPLYTRKVREGVSRVKSKLLAYNNLKVKLGDSKDKAIGYYGTPDRVEISKRHFPKGVVSTFIYNTKGLRLKFKGDSLYNIQVASNYKGAFYGIKIGDKIGKVKSIFKGKVVDENVTSATFASNEIDTDFIYSLEDDTIDGIEQNSQEIFGDWNQVLK